MSDVSQVAEVADAYVWGLPLVTMHRTRAMHGAGPGLAARDRLSTAADRSVVAPNNDTLYSSGWFDLGAGDLVIDVEPMDTPDRYWSVMLLDAYTNVRYVSRRRHGTGGTSARVVYDPTGVSNGETDVDQVGVVRIATRTVWVLTRVVVAGSHDLPAARAAQAGIGVSQPSGTDAGPLIVARTGASASDFFADLAAAMAVDPPAPSHPALPDGTAALLAHLPPADVLEAGVRHAEKRIAAHGPGADSWANGWGTRLRGADFGSDVLYRAAFAKYSLAGHLPAENRSYNRQFDGSGLHRLVFPPSGLPPVDAFWSLTLYGPDLFFTSNELDRYSIGDRTPGLRWGDDGSLTLLVGNDRPTETSNWLPAPAGPCFLSLRAYEGRGPVVDATWFPPDVEPVPAAIS